MYNIELTSNERNVLLDLLNGEILALDYIKDEVEYSSDVLVKLKSLKDLYNYISSSNFVDWQSLPENDYMKDWIECKFSNFESRLKSIEQTLQDDLK